MSATGRRFPDPRDHLLWPVHARAVSGEGGAPALCAGDLRLSHRDLALVVGAGAREIDRRFAPGSRLLVAAYDQLVVAIAFLAALASRSVPLLVDPQAPAGLGRVARRWRVAGALGRSDLLDGACEVLGEDVVRSWIARPAAEVGDPPAVHPDDEAFWTFTSGTTGEPRAVLHAHRGPLAAWDGFARRTLGLRRDDRTVSTAGLPFVYALGNNLLFPLLSGASAVLPPDLLLPTVLGELRRHGATVLVSGPWSLEAMARLADRAPWKPALAGLRLVLSAGEPLPEPVFERWRSRFGQAPIDNLGCTEMFNSFLAPTPEDARAGLLGGVVPGFEVRVGGTSPAPRRRGALSVRGPSRAIGISADDATGRIDRGGTAWCETGDEVEVDEEGRFRFLGRIDDRFKVRGQFVRPADVERRLRRVAGVAECMVVPGVDERGLACVSVRLVLDPLADRGDVRRRIAQEAASAVPSAARSIRIEEVASLPRSPRGKLVRERRAAS